MSPILVRPVREQLEHDRVIRLLQAKNKRKYDALINPGNERNTAVGTGPSALYPDLLLQSLERGHRLQAVVEVETGESVNHLEALSQWTHLARLRVPFHLYVPAGMVDVARRLCEDNQVHVSEIWSFHAVGDQVRFTLVHRSRQAPAPPPRVRPAPARPVAQAPAVRKKPLARTAAKPRGASRAAKPAVRVRKATRKAARPAKRR